MRDEDLKYPPMITPKVKSADSAVEKSSRAPPKAFAQTKAPGKNDKSDNIIREAVRGDFNDSTPLEM